MSNRKKTIKRVLGVGAVAAFCFAGAHSASALLGGEFMPFGGEFRGITRLTGKVVCSPCSLKDLEKTEAEQQQGLYQFTHKDQPAVFAVTAIGDFDGGRDASQEAYWRAITGLSRQVVVRVDDGLWRQIVDEHNRKRSVQLSGLLRSTGTLDIAEMTFLD